MSFGRIKLDPADIAFSRFIRKRDGECMRCHAKGYGKDGISGLQASHYFGRGRESTRFDPQNVDALCAACHRLWESDFREDYRAFKVRQLGETGFRMLEWRSGQIGRKDRKLSLIYARELLKTLT